MSYKFSKGYQIIGDLSGSDDAQRDTGIDFEDNYIGLQTSGSTVFVVSGSKVGIGTTTPDYELHVAGDIGVDQYIRHNGDSNTNINFTDDKINLKAGNLSMITMEEKSSAPHEVRINNGGNNIDFVVEDNSGNAYFTADASTSKIGIGTDTPSHKLDVDGDIRVRGNDIRDNSGNPAVTFDGSANTTIVNNLTVQDYTFPASDGNADQVLQTNGSGQLSFVDVSGGGGGGGSGGKVLQAVTSIYTGSFSGNSTVLEVIGLSGADNDDANRPLQVLITPNASSSKFIVMASLNASMVDNSQAIALVKIRVNEAGAGNTFPLGGNNAAGGTHEAGITFTQIQTDGNDEEEERVMNYTATGMISPNTTNDLRFTFIYKVRNASYPLHVNRTTDNLSTGVEGRFHSTVASTITVLEIDGS